MTEAYSLKGGGRPLIRAANGIARSSRQLVVAVRLLGGTHEPLGVDSIPRGTHLNGRGDEVDKDFSGLVQDQTGQRSLARSDSRHAPA